MGFSPRKLLKTYCKNHQKTGRNDNFMGNRGPATGTGGRPRKAMTDKIAQGKAVQFTPPPDMPLGVSMPNPRDYLSENQRDGTATFADEIYAETWTWLTKFHCEHLVSQTLVEQFAMAASRWIQVERAISKYGFLGKHPTTGEPTQSPFVAMSVNFSKLANSLWVQIYAIVRENASADFTGPNPQDDVMERLLRSRRGTRL
jgi:hypothetical protein